MSATVLHGDCLAVMLTLDAESVDAIVCDPPYALTSGKKGGSGVASLNVDSPAGRSRIGTGGGFMGKAWDSSLPTVEMWAEALRVARPGAHLVAFGGTRTFHRLTCAIEDAGWEIRDCLSWLYGSGFPKSLNLSVSFDKAEGMAARGVGFTTAGYTESATVPGGAHGPHEPTSANGKQWSGWGTALKPGWESIILARKPLPTGTERRIIVANLYTLEAQLWSLLPANIAAEAFGLSQAEHDAASASAQWSADERRSTWADLFGQMDTSRCVMVLTTCLSTVRSWSATLAESSDDTSTSTTATASSPTTDWRTLRFCLSALTPRTIIRDATARPGSWWSVSPAAEYFNAVVSSMSATRALSALGSAIESARIACRDEDAPDFSTAWEPIILARKPLIGTVAANVLAHGTGALNIDTCRIAGVKPHREVVNTQANDWSGGGAWKSSGVGGGESSEGRWPANVVLDDEAAALLDDQSGVLTSGARSGARYVSKFQNAYGEFRGGVEKPCEASEGGASRFFYTAKASTSERNEGLRGFALAQRDEQRDEQRDPDLPGGNNPRNRGAKAVANSHPTVKPLDLMRWLCKLVTPPGGLILDPFTGSGSTGCAAVREGFRFVGIEREAEYVEIARARIAHHETLFQPSLDLGGAA